MKIDRNKKYLLHAVNNKINFIYPLSHLSSAI